MGQLWRESVARFTQLGYSAFMLVDGRLTSVDQILSQHSPATEQLIRNVIFIPTVA